jgi:hypothetical protein
VEKGSADGVAGHRTIDGPCIWASHIDSERAGCQGLTADGNRRGGGGLLLGMLLVVLGGGGCPGGVVPRGATRFAGREPKVQDQNTSGERDGLPKSHEGSLSQTRLEEKDEHEHQDGAENQNHSMNPLARAPHRKQHEKNHR